MMMTSIPLMIMIREFREKRPGTELVKDTVELSLQTEHHDYDYVSDNNDNDYVSYNNDNDDD